MSKAQALEMLTGTVSETPVASGSLVTGEIKSPPEASETPVAPVTDPASGVKATLDSDRLALFSKKEAKLVKDREDWKVQKAKDLAEIEDLKAKLKDPYEKIKAFEELKQRDPVAAAKELGFSETDLFNFMSGAEKKEPTPEEIAKRVSEETLERFKKEQLEANQKIEKERNDQTLKTFKGNIIKTLESNKDEFEYCAFYGPMAQDLIYETVTAVLKSEDKLIDIKEAASMVEKYYEEQAQALKSLKKMGLNAVIEATPGVADPAVPAKEQSRPRNLPPLPQGSKTITNKIAATASSHIPVKENSEQKRARLIERLRSGA